MYASEVKERRLTFVVSGMLWQRSLVMMDLETRSLWSHLLGRAMRGPLQGAELESIPSVMTDWKTWRLQHPESTVLNLSRTSREYRREFYRDRSQFVIGMADGTARAWPFDELAHQSIVNDQFNDEPALIVFLKDSATALIYDRRLGERTLSFDDKDGKLVDRETGSQWDGSSGKALGGPLLGESLRRKVGIVSYRRAWEKFHPHSEYWRTNEK